LLACVGLVCGQARCVRCQPRLQGIRRRVACACLACRGVGASPVGACGRRRCSAQLRTPGPQHTHRQAATRPRAQKSIHASLLWMGGTRELVRQGCEKVTWRNTGPMAPSRALAFPPASPPQAQIHLQPIPSWGSCIKFKFLSQSKRVSCTGDWLRLVSDTLVHAQIFDKNTWKNTLSNDPVGTLQADITGSIWLI
jgi:hypothetical protein